MKLRFRDGLVSAVGLTVERELRFCISPRKYRRASVHGRVHHNPIMDAHALEKVDFASRDKLISIGNVTKDFRARLEC